MFGDFNPRQQQKTRILEQRSNGANNQSFKTNFKKNLGYTFVYDSTQAGNAASMSYSSDNGKTWTTMPQTVANLPVTGGSGGTGMQAPFNSAALAFRITIWETQKTSGFACYFIEGNAFATSQAVVGAVVGSTGLTKPITNIQLNTQDGECYMIPIPRS